MCNYKVCTSSINTTILTQVIQYPNITNVMLLKEILKMNFNEFFLKETRLSAKSVLWREPKNFQIFFSEFFFKTLKFLGYGYGPKPKSKKKETQAKPFGINNYYCR